MESENNNSITTALLPKDHAAQFRERHKNLTLLFKFFFITLILIISALSIYLIQDIASDYDQNPFTEIESRISLQTAAEELDDIASFILFNHLGPNADADTKSALKSCWRSLHSGSARIREALESDQRVGRMDLVRLDAGEGVEKCVGDLESVGSTTAAVEVRAKVRRAQMRLSGGGDFVGDVWREMSSAIGGAWDGFFGFVLCVCGLQLLVICYLLWGLFKFR